MTTLKDRELPCEEGVDEFPVQVRVRQAGTVRPVGAGHGDPVTVLEAGELLPARLCQGVNVYEWVRKDGEVFRMGSEIPADLYWPEEVTRGLVDAADRRAWVKTSSSVETTLHAQPGDRNEVIKGVAAGTEIRVGHPYLTTRMNYSIWRHGVYVPVVVDDQVGWMHSLVVDAERDATDLWGDLEIETVTVGDLALQVPVRAASNPVDPANVVVGRPGDVIEHLEPGASVEVSAATWQIPSGGWTSLPVRSPVPRTCPTARSTWRRRSGWSR